MNASQTTQNIIHYYFLPHIEIYIYIYFHSSKISGAYREQYSSELHLSIVSVQRATREDCKHELH
jgi:hypothetical protein